MRFKNAVTLKNALFDINAKGANGMNAFIIACEKGLTAIVAKMLEMAQEVEIDLNAQDALGRTGFIWACFNKQSEVIDILVTKAEDLNIYLQAKDENGKSGIDYYPEHFGIALKKAIQNKDIQKVLALKKYCDLDLKHELFQALKKDEDEFAIALIENSQSLNLPLSGRDEYDVTLLMKACACKKPEIAEAKAQDIAINARTEYGNTAFVIACNAGLTTIVVKMLEMAQEFKLELNTKELEYKFVQFFISNFFLQSKFLVSNLFITTLVHFEIPFQGNDKQPKSS